MRIDIMGNVENQSLLAPETINWLMDGDPAIRWQVMRDLLAEEEEIYEKEREGVAERGWGASYLSYQEPSGLWGGGIYGPKWISTTYTMLTLKRIGLPTANAQARMGCEQLMERGYYLDGGINYFPSQKQSEVCVTGIVLSVLSFFHYPDARVNDLADHLLGRQMPDGGWNCQDYMGDSHSSFHTTLSVLEGLLEYQKAGRKVRVDIETARLRGHEFLLQHRLFKSDRTGEIVSSRMLRMPFPPRWFYDFMKALDYFQDYYVWRAKETIDYPDKASENLAAKHHKDDRFVDAIELLKGKRKSDGRWNMMSGPSGKVYFDMEQAGKPSRWNTLRALRVLNWWEGVQ